MKIERPTAEARAATDWRSPAAAKALGTGLYGKVKEDEVTTRAAAFAYNTAFALPVLILLTITLAAVVDRVSNVQVAEHLRDLVRDRAPADTKDLLNGIADNVIAKVGGGAPLGVLFAAVLALWGG
jgi:uncharacterized BrkB/YihY/UPF0761 family membrane protein